MTSEVFAWLESTTLAAALRDSVWLYPLVNAGHILGIALLIGPITVLDLRILGLWPGVPVPPLWQTLPRAAAVGLALAASCGTLLFMARATEYAASPFFIAKMTIVTLATLNAWWIARYASRHPLALADSRLRPSGLFRVAAGMSLCGWICALLLGRLVGYF